MIRFINGLTGTEMFVADDRKEEYIAAGHVLAADIPVKAKKETVIPEKKEEPKETPKAKPKAPVRKSAPIKKK